MTSVWCYNDNERSILKVVMHCVGEITLRVLRWNPSEGPGIVSSALKCSFRDNGEQPMARMQSPHLSILSSQIRTV